MSFSHLSAKFCQSHLKLRLFALIGRAGVDDEVLQAGSRGFVGCLSSVQFNHLAPLKAAILNRGSSLVSVLGNLVESNCGELADKSSSRSLSGWFTIKR